MWGKFSVAAVSVLFLVGCSGGDVDRLTPPSGDPVLAGIVSVEGSDGLLDKSDHVVSVDGNSVTYMFGGSSSCPPLIDTVLWDSRSKTLNTVMFDYPETTACTMDYGQYFYVVDVDADVVNLDETEYVVKQCSRGECVLLER